MSTYPAEHEGERHEKLRQNTSFDTDAKSEDEVDSMHADSWSGGSVSTDAKDIARGDAPDQRTERGDRLPEPAEFEDPTSVTRPWAPVNPDLEDSDTDHAGRVRNPVAEAEPRQAPASPKQREMSDERPKISKPRAFGR